MLSSAWLETHRKTNGLHYLLFSREIFAKYVVCRRQKPILFKSREILPERDVCRNAALQISWDLLLTILLVESDQCLV